MTAPANNDAARELMDWRCRLGLHQWQIWFVGMAGHQSCRERRCLRCLDRGVFVNERQPRGYFGGPRGDWERVDTRVIA